ncbi:GTPase [Ovoidimarina sediminis]|uniref:GTPase n=1 Tax=Ovoidimarina sediminis TaxID=3079856 RepID=UPI002912BE56|nr:GTPase [Rhodophyticola sp. MJ-SS7]MDU8943351.1 GTPase [Rhodophyticola sp. MJ-SS7]
MTTPDADTSVTKRPVIALMGEFSAGKSTLSNLLLGEGRSPVKVTATQLPPVWYVKGEGNPVVVGTDGTETEIERGEIEGVDVASTAHIRIPSGAEILDILELIDMPGNSDPNMSAEVWQRSIHHADAVIWCTHANQAWRQSEAAVWEELPDALYIRSILLLTRFDKILGEKNRHRVLRRVQSETRDLFRHVLPISLTEALAATDQPEKWADCGAEAFTEALLDIVMNETPLPAEPAGPAPRQVAPRRVMRDAPRERRILQDRPAAE